MSDTVRAFLPDERRSLENLGAIARRRRAVKERIRRHYKWRRYRKRVSRT